MKTLTIEITGMHCRACVQNIQRALQATAGVQRAQTEMGQAAVTYDESAVDKSGVLDAIRQAGEFEVAGFEMHGESPS